MALISPGTEVTIIDDSTYSPAPAGTVPFVILATAQDKLNNSGDLAEYTAQANAGKVFLVTSQRELVNYYGKPNFYAPNGTPVHGYELNEYGLLAAYSALGVSNAAYIMRADVDLNALSGSSIRPVTDPADGTVWLDTVNSRFGVFEFNASSGVFTYISPANTSVAGKMFVITDTDQISANLPVVSLGKPGDYAVNSTSTSNPVYYKNTSGDWVLVGSTEWQNSWPAALGTTANATVSANSNVVINGTNVTVTGTSLNSVVSAINSANITGITADTVNYRLAVYVDGTAANSAAVLANGTGNPLTDLGVTPGTYYAPALQISRHTLVPQWKATDAQPRPTGSVWFKTSLPQNGAYIVTKTWDSATATWTEQVAPIFASDAAAIADASYGDPTGGGIGIATDFIYAKSDAAEDNTYTFKLFKRKAGVTKVTGTNAAPSLSGNAKTFTVSASGLNSATMSTPVTVSFAGNTIAAMAAAINNAAVDYVSAEVETSGKLSIIHSRGGVIYLVDGTETPLASVGITTATGGVRSDVVGTLILSNWIAPTYTASSVAPFADPNDGGYWYYNELEFDILINDGTAWKGYRTVTSDSRGYDLSLTDSNGPIVSASEPETQSDGVTALAAGDLWINTSDLENFPRVSRFDGTNWVTIDVTDHTSEDGIIFADARWATNGNVDIVTDSLATIAELALSNYTDADCPDYQLYPRGTLLFNTRRSGMNVKQFTVDALKDYDPAPNYVNAWVSASGLDANGVAYLGRKAQRAVVVSAMAAAVANSTEILEEVRNFNLMCCPGYPELTSTLQQLNVNRRETAFLLVDSPMRLAANSNDVLVWANNTNLAADNGEEGLVTYYEYMAAYYPSGYSRDLDGNNVVVPSTHMALRTIIRSDQKSYPWFAPAGPRRGTVDNATAVGYIDGQTGLFQSVGLGQGVRDTLYTAKVNPIPVLTGTGVMINGQKTRYALNSALDRVNVARLIVYLRRQLDLIARQYVFEPNDEITRREIKDAIEKELNSVKTQRGLYDYAVVCDLTNNTPLTIDRNELHVDVAIEPVKAAEFIYIPVRVKNTGDIAAGL